MAQTRITYDVDGDILYVNFGQPSSATGYQLSDQILLRIDSQTEKVIGLTIFNYSIHAESRREIPLPGLEDNPNSRSKLISTISSPPVSHFLRIADDENGARVTLASPSLFEAVSA